MSEDKKPESSPEPSGSGEHPVVRAMRAKMDSIRDNQLPELEAVIERLRALTIPVPRGNGHPDPRREDDGEIPVDIVDPPPDAA